MRTRWEYYVWLQSVDISIETTTQELNALGWSGWELVSAVRHTTHVEYLFKRQYEHQPASTGVTKT